MGGLLFAIVHKNAKAKRAENTIGAIQVRTSNQSLNAKPFPSVVNALNSLKMGMKIRNRIKRRVNYCVPASPFSLIGIGLLGFIQPHLT